MLRFGLREGAGGVRELVAVRWGAGVTSPLDGGPGVGDEAAFVEDSKRVAMGRESSRSGEGRVYQVAVGSVFSAAAAAAAENNV